MRKFLWENGLTLFLLTLFLASVVAQAIAGHANFNHWQLGHHEEPISIGRYVVSSDFGNELMENWQSEWLQTFIFLFATIWLVQRGSPDSKDLNQAGLKSDEEERIGEHAGDDSPPWAARGGWHTKLFSHSLGLFMLLLFLTSWAGQAITGRITYNEQQLDHHEAPVGLITYLGTGDFWDRTLQNWQSEFLALAASAILAVYLRQRGSTQSKPVGMPHDTTSVQE